MIGCSYDLKFEKVISDLVDSGLIKFYRRYVDYTLILVKPSSIPFMLETFFMKSSNLRSTNLKMTSSNLRVRH